MDRSRSYLPATIVALVLGLLLGGGAIAAVVIPSHSVGWNKLTHGVQKRISGKQEQTLQPLPGPAGPRGEPGERGEEGPEGPSGVRAPRCELVDGDCLIYNDEFWRLQAAFEPFETDTGEYPEPPFCMKAQAEGESVACAAVFVYLYPDGTLGDVPWVVDPAEPKGWRLY